MTFFNNNLLEQSTLEFEDFNETVAMSPRSEYVVTEFSSDGFADDIERRKLEKKFHNRLQILSDLDRKSVSFQLSKDNGADGWLKYREGYSSELVSFFLERMNLNEESIILDPFFGSGTTGFVCQSKKIASFGLDILPTSSLITEVRSNIHLYNLQELRACSEELLNFNDNLEYFRRVNHVPITKYAYEDSIDQQLAFLQDWLTENSYSAETNKIINLVILNTLEDLSYTKKDGQYLRWDHRSEKVKIANKKRIAMGREPYKTILDKGPLPHPFLFVHQKLLKVIDDISELQRNYNKDFSPDFRQESALNYLPTVSDDFFNGVITSPPYCNRYDYTRTYALELAYLGYSNDDIKELRQSLLTCTVENRDKKHELRQLYLSLGKEDIFEKVDSIIMNNSFFNEIIEALNRRADNGDLNNKGVIRMVQGYFYELTFIYYELFRVCKPGSKIYFVNDNVRYGGEIIPVDFLSCQIAEDIGFTVDRIFTIEQQKGNSSQQMKKFGRVALRKSITEWTVPTR